MVTMQFCAHIWDFWCFSAVTDVSVDYLINFYNILMADLGMTFSIAGIDGLDEGTESVEVVWFTDSCDVVLDAARKSVGELAVEGSIAPIDFGGELLKAEMYMANFQLSCILSHSSSFSASASMLNRLKLAWSLETSSS